MHRETVSNFGADEESLFLGPISPLRSVLARSRRTVVPGVTVSVGDDADASAEAFVAVPLTKMVAAEYPPDRPVIRSGLQPAVARPAARTMTAMRSHNRRRATCRRIRETLERMMNATCVAPTGP